MRFILITFLIGSPKTVIIAIVTTIVFKERVHHLCLYHLNRPISPITAQQIKAIKRRVRRILIAQAHPSSILFDKLKSQSV